ncbi:MAG: DUF1192 domain-containing protein [Hyphomicrobiales bacterium]
MDPEDLLPKKRRTEIVIGEDVTLLSVAELEHRIDLLKGEIERLTAAIGSKKDSRQAADSFFKR